MIDENWVPPASVAVFYSAPNALTPSHRHGAVEQWLDDMTIDFPRIVPPRIVIIHDHLMFLGEGLLLLCKALVAICLAACWFLLQAFLLIVGHLLPSLPNPLSRFQEQQL
jgi:hypothetical protein